MAEEIVTPAPDSTPQTTEGAPSTVETNPVVETPKVETPVVAPEAPAVAEKPKVETLIDKKPAEVKAEEKPAEVKTEEKPAEVKDAPVEVPVFELKLPETVTFDETKLAEVTKAFADFELKTKVPHEEMQSLAQSLMDRHVAELDRYTKSLTEAFYKQSNDWKDSFLKSPEFHNRTDTVLKSAVDAINIYGGDAKQQEEFQNLMQTTGVGNHPAMIRLLSNVMLAKAEPKPLAAPLIAQTQSASKIEKMYGSRKKA